jgi:hypothetical protein
LQEFQSWLSFSGVLNECQRLEDPSVAVMPNTGAHQETRDSESSADDEKRDKRVLRKRKIQSCMQTDTHDDDDDNDETNNTSVASPVASSRRRRVVSKNDGTDDDDDDDDDDEYNNETNRLVAHEDEDDDDAPRTSVDAGEPSRASASTTRRPAASSSSLRLALVSHLLWHKTQSTRMFGDLRLAHQRVRASSALASTMRAGWHADLVLVDVVHLRAQSDAAATTTSPTTTKTPSASSAWTAASVSTSVSGVTPALVHAHSHSGDASRRASRASVECSTASTVICVRIPTRVTDSLDEWRSDVMRLQRASPAAALGFERAFAVRLLGVPAM